MYVCVCVFVLYDESNFPYRLLCFVLPIAAPLGLSLLTIYGKVFSPFALLITAATQSDVFPPFVSLRKRGGGMKGIYTNSPPGAFLPAGIKQRAVHTTCYFAARHCAPGVRVLGGPLEQQLTARRLSPSSGCFSEFAACSVNQNERTGREHACWRVVLLRLER